MSCCWEWHTSWWSLEGNIHKGISFVAVPLLSMSVSVTNVFCSPSLSICLHLAPTGEGQSIDLLSPLPESGVKSAQGPPVFRPCSYIVSSGCWLLLQRQARERPKHHKDLTRKKPREGLRDSTTAQCSFIWIEDAVGRLPPTEVFFLLRFPTKPLDSMCICIYT